MTDTRRESDRFDPCPKCGGEPLSLGMWATMLELQCQCCGLIYRNREHELALIMNRAYDVREGA